MNIKKNLLLIIFFITLFFHIGYSQQQNSDNKVVTNSKVVYFNDGDGIFVYDIKAEKTTRIYKCTSPQQYFLPERMILYHDYIIFGIYNSIEGYKPYQEWKEEYYILNKNSGEIEPYSTLIFKEKNSFGMKLSLTEDFHAKKMQSVFAIFPKDIELIISETGGSPQIHALFKSVRNKCVFISGDTENGTSDKTIRLWDLTSNKIKVILEFSHRRLPRCHGGGGYGYPYFLNENEVIFAEFPVERGILSMFGIGLNSWCYIKILDLRTNKVTVIDKLKPAGTYPKISPCGRFIVYKGSDICLKDIKSGKITKIGQGHSPFWL